MAVSSAHRTEHALNEAISIRNITKTYGPKTAVDALDLVVPEGSLYGFIGPNGAGKTTTIRMVMSIIFPDRGEISVLGRRSAVESKDRIGYLPEERGVYRKMRVGAFLAYMAALKGSGDAPGRPLKARVREWLDRVGLADCERKRCMELSKGMQQKVQFLASIIHDPELIILDEPFSGLDPVNARLMRDLIHEMHARGRTIIFSTHVMQHAESICDHVVMIHKGRKALDASIPEIRGRFDPRSIVFEPSSPDHAADRAGKVEGVVKVRTDSHAFEATLAPGVEASDVLARLAGVIPMRRIELRRPSLEDIFIGLVKGDEEEGALRASLREQATGGGDHGA